MAQINLNDLIQMIGLETERLIFRQWKQSDYSLFAEFYQSEENARFVGGVKSPEESWRLMSTYIGHYVLNGYSYLAIDEKIVGRINWHHWFMEFRPVAGT